MVGIGNNALSDWTHRLTSWLVIVPLTLGTQHRVDLKDRVAHGDGTVRALRVTHIAVDAFIGDQQCHVTYPLGCEYPDLSLGYASAGQIQDPSLQVLGYKQSDRYLWHRQSPLICGFPSLPA